VEYTYDDNGNMTQKKIGTAAVNYIYDAANRLVKVEDDATQTVIAEYYYDPFGRRLWKEVGGTRTYFFYSEEGVIAEYDASGVEIRSYGYQPDSTWTTDPLFLKEGGTYYWYQNDHLGTPQKLVATDGTVVWSAQYTAFGEAVVDVATVINNLRFPGQYADDETGLHYNYFRYYDPKLGRYLRVDPTGLAGGINVFTYAYNTPLNAVDPLGLAVWELTIGGFAVAGPPGAATGAIVGLGIVVGGYAVCRASGGCRVEELPHITIGAPPSAIPGPYPEIRPISPFFPLIALMCDPDAIPKEKVKPIPKPKRRGKKCVCNCRAYCDENYANNPCIGVKLYGIGQGVAPTCAQAALDGKKDAIADLGGKPKHQECRCIDSKGNPQNF
jgi:RHS repeat-associated protein